MEGMRRAQLLLVEDEAVLRRLIAEFLRNEGFDVMEAADGAQGASLYADRGPFDLVLLDLNLPFLSGVDVCRRIRSLRPRQPVLICSAAILEWHVTELRAMDVDQFLTKPYHPIDLLNRIRLQITRGVAEVEGSSFAGRSDDRGPRSVSQRPSHPVQAAAAGIR